MRTMAFSAPEWKTDVVILQSVKVVGSLRLVGRVALRAVLVPEGNRQVVRLIESPCEVENHVPSRQKLGTHASRGTASPVAVDAFEGAVPVRVSMMSGSEAPCRHRLEALQQVLVQRRLGIEVAGDTELVARLETVGGDPDRGPAHNR